MEAHYNLTDQEFATQFENCTLDPSLFSHEAHLRLAWIHITQYGLEQACENLCAHITRFDATFGDGTKFHKTLTIAAANIVQHFLHRTSTTTFQDFIAEFPRLNTNFRDLIGAHYGFNIFTDSRARVEYLAPDLQPF